MLCAGNCYTAHCPQTLAWWLEPWTATLAAISVFFCAADFPVVCLTTWLMRMFQDVERY